MRDYDRLSSWAVCHPDHKSWRQNRAKDPVKTTPGISLKPLPGEVDVSAGVRASSMREMALALVEHKVILLREQKASPEAYAAFARDWGTPRIDGFTELNLPGFDDLSQVGNTGGMLEEDEYRNGASSWHTDCAAEPDPNATTMLYCIRAPAKGGETVIADMQAAYEALDEATREEIDTMTAHHCYSGTQEVLGGREDWEYPVQPVTEQTASQIPSGAVRPLARKSHQDSVFSVNQACAAWTISRNA